MKLKIYIALLLSCFSLGLFAQEAEFKASVSKNKLGVNQRLKIEFSIKKNGVDNFEAPEFKNFDVIGGPSQSISQTYINGKFSVLTSYTFIIQPKRKGEFVIPAASIEVEGKRVSSNTVKVKVLDAVDIPKDPNDPNYVAQQNIHLVAEISNGGPYVGEGVYVEYRLYVSGNVNVYNFGVTQAPQYSGFWHQDIKANASQVKEGMYNGEKYRYVVLQKALLIPTKSGKLTIDPMEMEVVVGVPTGRVNFFGEMVTRNVRKNFSSAKKIIRAKELPLANKPEGFTGAVGEFSYDVALSKNTLKANESSQLTVTVKGKGNLKLFEIPKAVTPEELEVYQPERKENVRTKTKYLSGAVSDVYTLVPQYKGKYKIPKSSFSYFNPKQGVYQTITSDDLYVDVLEGKELNTNSDNTSIAKQDVKETGKNFRYIQSKTSFSSIETSDFFKSTLYYILLLLPLLAIPIAIFVYNKNEERKGDIVGNRLRKADKLAKKYLSKAEKQLGNKEAFYEALEKALHNYLKAKLGVETSDISRDKITDMLSEKGVSNESIKDFINVFNACDFARYTPIDSTQMQQEYENAKQVITQLDKQL